MGGRDAFYTPSVIAELLVACVAGFCEPASVADFSAGDGSLLAVAERRWPNAEIIATDIDKHAVLSLGREFSHWRVGRVNFVNKRSRAQSAVLKGKSGSIQTILLNPPFSCRGARKWPLQFFGEALTCSLAMAFVGNALAFLGDRGCVATVLPAGTLSSEKDQLVWAAVRKHFRVDVVSYFNRGSFQGCFPRTVAILIRKVLGSRSSDKVPVRQAKARGRVRVLRGRVQMHSVVACDRLRGVPLIHSTHLRDSKVNSSSIFISSSNLLVRGPAILFPRVGRPNVEKVCFYSSSLPIALSDCVVAIKCSSIREAASVDSVIRDEWAEFEQVYGGTCAPYITLKGVHKFLEERGFQIVEEALSQPSETWHQDGQANQSFSYLEHGTDRGVTLIARR